MTDHKLRIGILGVRGVPARFGGSETVVEEIGSRLALRGHQVTVYCRRHNTPHAPAVYKGMRRIVLPSLNTLNFDLLSHTFLSLAEMVREKYDVVHFHGVGNALLLPMFKMLGKGAKSLVVVDGPDWQRPKWGPVARLAFRTSFPMAVRLADEIISDNIPAQQLLRARYSRHTPLVGYGADVDRPLTRDALAKHGLEPGRYILQVAALVPDKGVHLLVEAYEGLATDLPLVIVGDTPYATGFKAKLHATSDRRIRFLGYIYGTEYRELLANCFMYIHPLLVDGTSPALLQAMAYGCCIVASDLPETLCTLGDTGRTFASGDPANLRQRMAELLADRQQTHSLGRSARQRVIDRYSWDRVTDEYERLSLRLACCTTTPAAAQP